MLILYAGIDQGVENDIPHAEDHGVDRVTGGCGGGHGRVVSRCFCRSPHRRHSDSYRSRREEKPSQPIVTNVSS